MKEYLSQLFDGNQACHFNEPEIANLRRQRQAKFVKALLQPTLTVLGL